MSHLSLTEIDINLKMILKYDICKHKKKKWNGRRRAEDDEHSE